MYGEIANYHLSLCCVTVAGPPTITSVALVSPSTIRVYWSPPTKGAAVTGYRVNYTSRGVPQFPGSATHRSRTMERRDRYLDFTHLVFENGISYTITVEALSEHLPGVSIWSTETESESTPGPTPGVSGDMNSTARGDMNSTSRGDMNSTSRGDMNSTLHGDMNNTLHGERHL